jgi:hypothetical protein
MADIFSNAVVVDVPEDEEEKRRRELEGTVGTSLKEDAPTAPQQQQAAAPESDPADPFADAVVVDEPEAAVEKPDDNYEGMSFSEANAKYESLLKLPDVKRSDRRINPMMDFAIYTNPETEEMTYIRRPFPSSFKGAANAIGEVLRGNLSGAVDAFNDPPAKVQGTDTMLLGASEFLGNAAETAAAGVDYITGDRFGLTEKVDRLTPEVELRGLGEELIGEGLPQLAAALYGGGAVRAGTAGIAKGIEAAPAVLSGAVKALRGFGIVLAGEGAAVAGADKNSGTLLIGEGAMLPIVDGLDLGDSASEQVLETRLNMLSDALITGGVIMGVGGSTVALGKGMYDFALKPLINLTRGTKGMESAAYTDVMTKLTKIDINTTPDEIEVIKADLLQAVETNKDVLIRDLSDTDSGDVTYMLDTMTAMLEGTTDPRLIANIEGLRNGMLQNAGDNPQTVAAIGQSNSVLDGQLEKQATALGGKTASDRTAAMGDAAGGLVDSARREVDEIQQPLRYAENRLAQAESDILRAYETSPELSARLTKLQDLTGTEVIQDATGKVDSITQGLRKGYETMRDAKNARYAAISGGDVDAQQVIDIFSNLTNEQISAGVLQMGKQAPLAGLVNAVRPFDTVEGKFVELEPDELLARVSGYLKSNNADFGFFYNTLRPEFSALANNLYQSGNPGGGSIVRGIVNKIDVDMVDHVARTDLELAEAATEATRYFREEFAPMWRGTGKMAEYAEIYDSTVARTSRDVAPDQKSLEFDSRGYDERAESFTTEALQGNRMTVRNMRDALDTAGNPNDVADFYVMEAQNTLARELRSAGDLGSLDIGPFRERIGQYSAQLNEAYPEAAGKLNDFLRKVEDAQGSRAEMNRVLEEITKKSEEATDRLLSGELSTFFNQVDMPELAVTSNPREAFRQLFESKEAVSSVARLQDRIDSLPYGEGVIVRKGMQTAYNRFLDSKIFGAKRETGGLQAVNAGRVARSVEETTQEFAVGDVIFRDTPEVMESIRAMSELAQRVTASKGSSPVAAMSATAYNKAAQTATNKLIYMVVGPLSRVGTQIRTVASRYTASEETAENFRMVKDRMFADPAYFAELARRYNKQPTDPIAKDMLTRFMSTSVIRSTGGDDGAEGGEDENSFLNYSAVDDTARQVLELFGTGEDRQ